MSREKFDAYMALYWKLNGRWPDSETVWNAAISEHENQIETLRGVVVGYKQRIAELEKDVDILQTNLDAALRQAALLEQSSILPKGETMQYATRDEVNKFVEDLTRWNHRNKL